MDIEYQLGEVQSIAKKILANHEQVRTFWLTGDLGAGKTTLITAFCQLLDVKDQVSSPTFSIINEYATKNDGKVYHMDLYRLKDVDEAINIGVEDYIYTDNYTFIEWPEIIESLLPEDILRIHIQNIDNSTRKILFL